MPADPREIARRQPPKRRVLIRTFPPTSNANYGGILQSWALQRTIENLGCIVYVDGTRSDRHRPIMKRFGIAVRVWLADYVPLRLIPARFRQRLLSPYSDSFLLRFARRRMRIVNVYGRRRQARSRVVKRFDAFVAGSDQVWRPRYVDVETYLFDFLPETFAGPRVAYAASFGSDAPEFTDELIARTAPLARQLTAASVREDSGVGLCERLWEIDAVQMPDPTLLVPVEHYRELAAASRMPSAQGTLVSYVLDRSAEKSSIVAQVAAATGVTVRDIHQAFPDAGPRIRAARGLRKPTVEEWLHQLSTADYVITDSFHGCVFATIFERPFLVIPNATRGVARFTSFLATVGLDGRLLHPGQDPVAQMNAPIVWDDVRAAIDHDRGRARVFLQDALRSVVGWSEE